MSALNHTGDLLLSRKTLYDPLLRDVKKKKLNLLRER
jgi:hypothetical protein